MESATPSTGADTTEPATYGSLARSLSQLTYGSIFGVPIPNGDSVNVDNASYSIDS